MIASQPNATTPVTARWLTISGKPSPSRSPIAGGLAATTRFSGSSIVSSCEQSVPFKILTTP
ncbi:MAG TPA: hypothetical protein VGB85_32245 [Nannocystis sp.]